ncbi:ABC transporter permease [Aliamphritea ceti]|uniref:ABC transporter permease n=1 Tax=Aliamphritea ceti TaxID=1524258 RepID=UPI0021C4866A|nr:ABC transporter permease [Aliamphritea ceti]
MALASNSLTALVVKRIALGLGLLLAISALIFAGTEMLPGDVAQSILGQSATPEALANLRADMGLNTPPLERYLSWLGGILQGDLGNSLSSGRDIGAMIGGRLGNTLFLAATTAIIAVPLAVILGMVAVHFRNGIVDKLISITTITAISLPEFFIGYLLILVFAVNFGWLPSSSLVYEGMSLGEKLTAIALPCATLTLVVLAHMMRMTRAAILNVMSSAYIETAELKGISPFKIIFHHAFPNAISPIITVVVLNLAYLVVGVVIVEIIFVYPGMGQLLVDHVTKRDVPVVQATGLIFAAIYILLNVFADVMSIIANPRLRHPK